MDLSVTSWIVIAAVILLIITIMVIYNKLVRYRNYCRNGFAQIDVQLTRRYDLIPNLVAVAEKYMDHESSVLQAVINARGRAESNLEDSRKKIGAMETMSALASSEGILNGALGGLLVTVEAYPELQADKQMARLTDELVHTENRIAFARQGYNDNVMQYNIVKESFPNNLVSSMFGFEEMAKLELEFSTEAPKVSL